MTTDGGSPQQAPGTGPTERPPTPGLGCVWVLVIAVVIILLVWMFGWGWRQPTPSGPQGPTPPAQSLLDTIGTSSQSG